MPDDEVLVIVPSFNRPRMLKEALASIKGADEVLVLDDGSDFDVEEVVGASGLPAGTVSLKRAPCMTVDERMRTPRMAKAMNRAILETGRGIVAYLCDDDLFHPDWPDEVRKFFATHPEEHVVRASWGFFEDGKAPDGRICQLGEHGMTAGNFAHRRACSIEHGLWWSEHAVAVPDHNFVRKIAEHHPWARIPALKVLAGWRRLHATNMLQFTNGDVFMPTVREVLGRGMLG